MQVTPIAPLLVVSLYISMIGGFLLSQHWSLDLRHSSLVHLLGRVSVLQQQTELLLRFLLYWILEFLELYFKLSHCPIFQCLMPPSIILF